MAWDSNSLTSPVLPPRGQSGSLLTPETVAGRIVNMELTESGTLRAVRGPIEYHPASWEDNGGSGPAATIYGTPLNGIFHCRTYGGVRDILLVHHSSNVWVHKPWEQDWYQLLGPGGSGAEITTTMVEDDGRPAFLTQFEATPNGVVIAPQGGRAHFYDGEFIAPLGYQQAPGPPTPMGPKAILDYDTAATTPEEFDVVNRGGYAHNTRQWDKATEREAWETGAAPAVGTYRLGSIRNDSVSATGKEKLNNPLGGVLEDGEWRAAVQFVDVFGNLSPIGEWSAPVRLSREDNLVKERKKDLPETAERMRMQFGWGDLALGPSHTVARNLYRTKDQLHTDLPGMFWLTPNSTAGGTTFATLEDVAVDFYPDNIPDSWLLRAAIPVGPMPRFRLCKLAFGRMWYANMVGNEGLVQNSYPGLWGTLDPNSDIYPDATGTAVTGMHMAQGGLLLFTETSTFLVTPNDSGQGFIARTLSPSVGCVSPDSIETMPNGLTMWLGREGFFGFDGERVAPMSAAIKEDIIRRINKVWRLRACAAVDPRMGEYRCWIPVDGSTENNLCVVYDSNGWRERNDIKATAVCTTRDERQYMLAIGKVETSAQEVASVWLLDHEGEGNRKPTTRECLIETTWLRNASSRRSGSPTQLDLWLRETTSGNATIEVMRDWREYPTVSGAGKNPALYPDSDAPPFWDTAVYGSTYKHQMSGGVLSTHIVERRPYWTNVALSVPSCEVFKVRIKYTGDLEFAGFGYELLDRNAGGANKPEGT